MNIVIDAEKVIWDERKLRRYGNTREASVPVPLNTDTSDLDKGMPISITFVKTEDCLYMLTRLKKLEQVNTNNKIDVKEQIMKEIL